MEAKTYDLVVIGGGPAGEKGAVAAARFGKRVALVEKGREIGGAVANTGTLPSKTLRETALALSGVRARKLYGVDLSLRREATVADFMHHERQVTANERQRALRNISDCRVELVRGFASFVDDQTVKVTRPERSDEVAAGLPAEILLRAGKILIATGSTPHHPPEFPFDDPRVHDSDEILELDRLPRTLVVVGAGVIGSEYACTFAALGAKVTVIDGKDVLLPFLDLELSTALAAGMENLGVTFHWQDRISACDVSKPGEVVLKLESGKVVRADQILVAAGRGGNTEGLNLAAAGITPGKRGLLTVDDHFVASAPHVYAVGDVIGFPALASTSMEQARIAMCHAFEQNYKSEMARVLPTGIYTIPEVSMVGETEESLKAQRVDYIAGRASYRQNARGEIIGDSSGFLKLLFRRGDLQLLGVHVIGEQATEIVHIGLMAMLTSSGAELFNRACFNYPTLGDLYKIATYDAMLKSNAPLKPRSA
jgi:NAD(P) transhydrogenase